MIRMTPEEWAAKKADIDRKMRARVDSVAAGGAARPGAAVKERKKGRRNLYGARRIEIDGIQFDSEAEGKRYAQLKLMERAGEISNLEVHPSFDLIPEQKVGGKKERPVRYVADFRYQEKSGENVVEDVKCAPTKTREYIIKRKLMMLVHGIVVKEVLMA